jgi:hypothetical protein
VLANPFPVMSNKSSLFQVNGVISQFNADVEQTRLFKSFLKLVQINFIFANNIAYIIYVL